MQWRKEDRSSVKPITPTKDYKLEIKCYYKETFLAKNLSTPPFSERDIQTQYRDNFFSFKKWLRSASNNCTGWGREGRKEVYQEEQRDNWSAAILCVWLAGEQQERSMVGHNSGACLLSSFLFLPASLLMSLGASSNPLKPNDGTFCCHHCHALHYLPSRANLFPHSSKKLLHERKAIVKCESEVSCQWSR